MILNFFKTKNKLFEKDCKITYQYDGLITLEFEKDEDEEVLCEEPFFISNENQFIVKNIDENTITCELDFTSLKKDFFVGEKKFESLTLNDILHQLLDKVNWTVKNAQSIKSRRTLEVEDESLLSAIFKLEKLYDCTFEFDCKNKILTVVDEGRKREYNISKDINLEDFIIKKDTFEHYTRIYGFGKDNMTFESINGGKEYVENTKYNQNIIPAVFRDDRFTDKLNLKKHCEELLEKYSKPLIEYELSIVELDGIKLKLHDIVTFLNHKTKRKEEHRIIEYTRYTEDETKSEIKFINRATNLSEFITHQQDTITTEIQKEIGKYDFKTKFDEDIKKATARFENLLINGHKIETKDGTYYVDQLPKEKAKNVLRIGLGGIMGSSNGWNGPYSLAIGNDGSINADRIITGFLDADRIKANSITSDKLTAKAKEEIINGLVTETKYTELVADNTKFKSQIGQTLTEKFDNLQIGARNLARNSQNFDEKYWVNRGAEKKIIERLESWNGFDSVEFKGVNPNKSSRVSGIYDLAKVFEIEFKQGQNYTVSFDAINLSEIPFKFLLNGFDKYNKIELKANEQKRVVLNGIKNDKNYSRIAVLVDELGQDVKFSIKNIKITKDLSDIILEKVPIDMNLWKSWRASQKLIGKILKKSDWDGVDSVEFKGVYAAENIGDDGLVGLYRLYENHTHKIEFKQGQIYTVSFDAINLSEIPFKFCLDGFDKYNVIELKANEQKRIILNGIKKDGSFSQILVLIGEALVEEILVNELRIDIKFKVKKLKIEEGNKATTWTPAVEDIEDTMKTSESKIANIVEKTTTLTQNQEMLLVKVNSKIDKNETEKWLKFSDDGLELGEKNGNMKLRISNNKISYINNDVEESFWNNKSFYVKSSLKIGEFDIVPETDGSISLI